MTGSRMIVVPGLMIQGALSGWCAAAAGAAALTAAARPAATAAGAASASTSAFVSPGPLTLALDLLDPWQK